MKWLFRGIKMQGKFINMMFVIFFSDRCEILNIRYWLYLNQ